MSSLASTVQDEQHDNNLVYALNCHEINGKPPYVFKTLRNAKYVESTVTITTVLNNKRSIITLTFLL